MRKRNQRKQIAPDGDLFIRAVTVISLVGVVMLIAAIGAMFCMTVHTSAFTKTTAVQAQQVPANSGDDTTKNSTGMQGEVNFDAGKIQVNVRIGIRKGQVVENRYAPYHVQLENTGKNFEGYFRVYSGQGSREAAMFQKKVSIASGESKKLESVFYVPQRINTVTVALCDKKGGIIEEKLVALQATTASAAVKEMGVFSEDTTGLGYLSGANFNVTELSKEDFMEDARGLDVYDVLVLNNVDTQSFRDKQIAAINLWVRDGGTLILGTGSQAEKTLKAFSGNLLNGTIGSTRTIQTQFGDYENQKALLRQQLQNDLHDEKMEAVREFLYNNLSTSLRNTYYDDIKNLDYQDYNGSWKNSLLSTGGEIYKALSKQYKAEDLEEIFEVSTTDAEKKELDRGLDVERIAEDITTLTIDHSESILTENGEKLLSKLACGRGCVIVSEFDLSLENKYWGSYGAMLKTKFFQNSTTDIYSNMSATFSSDYDSTLTEGLNINEVSGLPNMALYLFLLILYVMFVGPVAYVLLRRKDKRHLLWKIVPASAVLCSVIIYLIGTSTRIQKPYINYLSQLFINGEETAQMETAFSLTSPNNNSYQVELEGAVDVRPYFNPDDWYYMTTNTTEKLDHAYKYGIEYASDATTLHMDYMSAFDSATMWNRQTIQHDGQIEFSALSLSEKSSSGIVTNQLDYDLEDCVIVFEGNMIYLGDLAKGESVSLDQIDEENIIMYDSYSSDWYSNVRQVFYGDNYYDSREPYKERRKALLEYYGNAFINGNTLVPSTYFYGFRADGGETAFNKLFSLKQYGETAVIQEITADDTMKSDEVKVGRLSDYMVSLSDVYTDDNGELNLTANSIKKADVSVDVVYDLTAARQKYKSLTAKYLSEGNQEFRLYSVQNYISGTKIFLGTISVQEPKAHKMVQWGVSGQESGIENLENYMDESGKITMRYTFQSNEMLEGFYDQLQLPVIQIAGK
ncbi:MAG: hypothetical protein J1E62_08655 [Lachnospiraceae bacterium]|nr:hypothetical protein [Lachnospiraceae bacterium]